MSVTNGSTEVVALDISTAIYGEEFDFGGAANPVAPYNEDPTPGDPDTAYTPTPTSNVNGIRHQLLLCEPITHRPLADLRSFRLDYWMDRHGAPGEIVGTASVWDPAWSAIGINPRTMRGRSTSQPDLKGCEVVLSENGILVAAGIFQEPVTFDDVDTVRLAAVGPEAVFDERTLGETDQRDFLDGRGSFPTTDLSGFQFDAGTSHTWQTTSPWQGTRSLRVRSTDGGNKWVYTPWINLNGQEGFVRHPLGSAMIRSQSASEGILVATFVQLTNGTPVRSDYSIDNAGETSQETTDWQGPITSRGWLTPQVVPHKVRSGILLPADESYIDIDYWRIGWPTLTGFPNQQDLSLYPGRIVRDFQYREGGSPEGIGPTVVKSSTGSTAHISWAHADDHPVGEAMRSITDRDDGPDVWITPTWQLNVAKRRGTDRRDLALTGSTVRSCRFTFDPGGEIDELRALTNLGTGATRVLFGVDQPKVPNRRRIRQLVQTPPGLDYDAGSAWARGQAEWAARQKVSAEVTVSYGEGEQYATGDGVMVALNDGNISYQGPMRVAGHKFTPADNTCILYLGLDPKVRL